MGDAADLSYGVCFATVQRKQALGEAEDAPLAGSAHAMPTVSAAPRKLLPKVPPGSPPFERSWNVGTTRPGQASVCLPNLNALPCPPPCCDSNSGGCTPVPTQHKLHFMMPSVLCSSYPEDRAHQRHCPGQHQHTEQGRHGRGLWMNKRGK